MTVRVAPRIALRLPKLYPKQAAFVNAKKKFTVCFASTKAGKSVALIAWVLSEMWSKGAPGRDWYWIAPAFGVSKIMYMRLCRWLIRADPERKMWRSNDSDQFVELKNGARVYFKGGDRPDMLFGPDAWGVVIDEGTRCRPEVLDAAVSITTATGGQVKVIGNMKSRGHWMYKMWWRGKDGDDQDIDSFKLDAWDAVEGGVLKREVVLQAKRNLPEHVFKALYLAEPTDSGTNPFGFDAIQKCRGPGSTNKPAAVGVDLAKSIDWNSVCGLDLYGYCSLYERWQSPWLVTMPRLVALIGKTKALVDSTGVGDPIVESLQSKLPNVLGMKFTSQSKQMLMEGLAVAVQSGELHGLPDHMIEEMEIFEFEYTATGVRYTAPEGMHDDDVCSLALAVHRLGKVQRMKSRIVAPVTTDLTSPYEA